jgi:hypothetical protein
MLFLYKCVAAVIVFGTWATSFQLAKTFMAPTYAHSLIMLRTKSRVADTRLLRIFGSVVGYAMVLNLIAIALMSGGILMKDTEDRFGFATFAVSWEFMIHPTYFMIMILMTLVAFSAMMWKYSAESKKENITIATYSKVTNLGMAVWVGTGTVILTLLMMHTYRTEFMSIPASITPSGKYQGHYVALSVLTSSASENKPDRIKLKYIEDYRDEMRDIKALIPEDEVKRLDRFVNNIRGRGIRFQKGKKGKNDARKLSWAMREKQFDEGTRKHAMIKMEQLSDEHVKRIQEWNTSTPS